MTVAGDTTIRRDPRRSTRTPALRNSERDYVSSADETALKQLAVVLKVAGYDQRRIASQLGLSQPTVSRWLREPQSTEYERYLTRHLVKGTVLLLRSYAMEAVETLAEVMRSAESDKFKLDAAKAILDRIGLHHALDDYQAEAEDIAHPSRDDPFLERLRQAPPDIQEQVAALIEDIEALLNETPPDPRAATSIAAAKRA